MEIENSGDRWGTAIFYVPSSCVLLAVFHPSEFDQMHLLKIDLFDLQIESR